RQAGSHELDVAVRTIDEVQDVLVGGSSVEEQDLRLARLEPVVALVAVRIHRGAARRELHGVVGATHNPTDALRRNRDVNVGRSVGAYVDTEVALVLLTDPRVLERVSLEAHRKTWTRAQRTVEVDSTLGY